jgi:DedD protein
MDRRVKERLVGASILVVLLVLIVPELLSGPAPGPSGPSTPRLPASAPEPVRNVTVDLATSKPPEPVAEPATPASSAQLPEPRTAATASVGAGASPGTGINPAANASPSAAAASVAPSEPLESAPPPPTSISAAKPATAARAWAVQLGSFASHANADKLVRQLKAQGFAVYVLSGGSGASARYRVRVGPMADRGAASQAITKLKALGHMGSLVPPAS